jgi:hypothetical protein
MKERNILIALIQSRDTYDAISAYHEDTDFTDMGELIYKEIDKYYSRDDKAKALDVESLSARLRRAYPRQYEKFESFLSNIKEVSVGNIIDDYRAMKSDSLGELIGGYLLAGEHSKAEPLLEKYNALQAEGLTKDDADAPKVYIDSDVDDFGDSLKGENRIPIAPIELNEAFDGGLIRGSHTLIYAPPECGKTATAINLAYSTACHKRTRKGCKTLYIGNEESDDMYLNRMLCRFTQWTREEVEDNPKGAMELARSRGWANLIFVHLSPGSIPQVQKLILEHMPDVVIIDQLANLLLGQGKEPEKTQLLERNAYAMRMFYSKHKIAGVSMSQADEKAIGKLHLTIKDVYYSNIGVQGQVDAMIGIGMNDSYASANRRVLNITKNKLGGKHTHIVVELFPKISALKAIG